MHALELQGALLKFQDWLCRLHLNDQHPKAKLEFGGKPTGGPVGVRKRVKWKEKALMEADAGNIYVVYQAEHR